MPYLDLDGEPRELAPETTIGSGAQASWRIANKDLAARHFTLHLTGAGDGKILPGSDQNVVTVNGRQVPTAGAPVSSGDVIAAGAARFTFIVNRNDPRPRGLGSRSADESYLVDMASRQAHHLRKRTIQIGREAVTGIVLRDPQVSRHHADIRAEGGGYALYSSGSSGTMVNGQALRAPRLLTEGDMIRIGSTTFTYTQVLPKGVAVVEPAGTEEEDTLSRRATVVSSAAVPAAMGGSYAVRRAPSPIILGTIAVTLLGVMYFVLR
ncbi:MAG: FHA domain-containing protein [Gemmatimonadaceae bacterium]